MTLALLLPILVSSRIFGVFLKSSLHIMLGVELGPVPSSPRE